METTNKYIVNEGLKSEIKKRLKTFSELKNKYTLDKIYRSGEEEFFSEKAKFAKLEGVPKSRPATILSNSYNETSETSETIETDEITETNETNKTNETIETIETIETTRTIEMKQMKQLK